MSINGAVCCFFFVFLIPVLIQIKSYRGDNELVNTIKRSLSVIGMIRPDIDIPAEPEQNDDTKIKERLINKGEDTSCISENGVSFKEN